MSGTARTVSPAEVYDDIVAPAMYPMLDQLFPELMLRPSAQGWRGGWGGGANAPLGISARGDRCVVRRHDPGALLIYGGDGCDFGQLTKTGQVRVPWLNWMAKSATLRGGDWIDMLRRACGLVGLDHEELLGPAGGDGRGRVSDEELAARRERERALRAEAEARHSQAEELRRIACRELWAAARAAHSPEILRGYLRARLPRLTDAELDAMPPSLVGLDASFSQRFAERGIDGQQRWRTIKGPMVMAVVIDTGRPKHDRIGAVHRIYLDPADPTRKRPAIKTANGEVPAKLSLGPMGGGSVWLGGGSAAAGFDDTTIWLTEGIETGLAVRHLTGCEVYACVSANGLQGWVLPEERRSTTRIIVAGDNDGGDEGGSGTGERAAQRSAERLREMHPQIAVEVAIPRLAETPAGGVA